MMSIGNLILLPCFAASLLLGTSGFAQTSNIRPYKENSRYWQYKGAPVLLLGATDNDNLFQNENVETHLDSLEEAGGNYIRNTMSDRDTGDEKAFYKKPDGRYDLDKWNKAYWSRLENLLKLASERNIIVQIEIWDRFDHSGNEWNTDPYNPKNNINYTYGESGLDSLYPLHPGKNEQPFFFTVPGLNNNEVLLKYQQAFVQKMLSIALKYDNVLYCIDNETSGEERWSSYWADYIRNIAKGRDIYITEMWDDWELTSETHKRTFDHPDRYGFIDISQNSHMPGYENWENAQYVFDHIKENPRPVNSTKIYGNDIGKWTDRGITTEHAIQTFCRNITGGFASSRFHRPPSGLGLSPASINSIKTIRKIETVVKMWELSPRMDLLKDNEKNEAYLSAKEGEYYVIYFTKAGTVKLDLRQHNKTFTVKWIGLKDGEWGKASNIKGGSMANVEAIYKEGCFAVIMR